MVNYSLELAFTSAGPDAEVPSPPIARIFIQTQGSWGDGLPCISPLCHSYEELENEVRRLEKELQSIRERGKAMFEVIPR